MLDEELLQLEQVFSRSMTRSRVSSQIEFTQIDSTVDVWFVCIFSGKAQGLSECNVSGFSGLNGTPLRFKVFTFILCA